MRRPILAANWKMQTTTAQAIAFAETFIPLVADSDVDIVIAPPFTALDRLGSRLAGTAISLAAQNVNPCDRGAFTGEIAPGMLVDLGCAYAIVGHSERRALYAETDALVSQKAAALLASDIRPIVCVGETLAQRDAGTALNVVAEQLAGSLNDVPKERAADIVIAYEPVWAIGTGRTATPQIAQEVHASIRSVLGRLFGAVAADIRIQYGGSVKPETVYDLMNQSDIDGALVGGASLDPVAFSRIVRFEREGSQ